MALSQDSERKQFTSTLKAELYNKLKIYSDLTDIPISKILDRAVSQFFDELQNQHQQGKS